MPLYRPNADESLNHNVVFPTPLAPIRLKPWDYIEEKYASRMSTKNGRKAYSVRVALGACIIKTKEPKRCGISMM